MNRFLEILPLLLLSLTGCAGEPTRQHHITPQEESKVESDRYIRGLEKLKEIDGHAGERVIERLRILPLILPATLSNFRLVTSIRAAFFHSRSVKLLPLRH